MDDTQRQEIVKLLVKQITVHTELEPEGKRARVRIEYLFNAVVNDFTDIRGERNYNTVSRTVEIAAGRGSGRNP